jgi:NAD(P)-dependent dehydrogenase (short-subunit alcohol dehydrogenase family)
LTNDDGSLTSRGEAIITDTPAGRFGSADELVGALVFLASPASTFVTGTVISVDGGFGCFSGV